MKEHQSKILQFKYCAFVIILLLTIVGGGLVCVLALNSQQKDLDFEVIEPEEDVGLNAITDYNLIMSGTGTICKLNGRTYTKLNSGVAYVCVAIDNNSTWRGPLLVSQIQNAVTYRSSYNTEKFAARESFTYNGKTWYVSGGLHMWQGSYTDTSGNKRYHMSGNLNIGTASSGTALLNAVASTIRAKTTVSQNIFRTGSEINVVNYLSNYDANIMTLSGTTKATDAGTYTCTVSLNKKTVYMWDDCTQGDLTISWTIKNLQSVSVPSQNGTLTYNGNNQTPNWNNYNSSQLTLSVTAQKNAGTYSATFTPKTGYCWSGTNTSAKSVNWTIQKANITPTVNMNGYTYGGTKSTPSVSGNSGNGGVTYYYSSSNSASGGTAWTNVNSATYLNAGTYYMYAVVAATTNYNGKTSATKAFTISRASINPTVNMNGYTYGGTKSTPSISGNTGNGTVTYYYNTTNSTSGGTAWTNVTSSTALPAGTYYMYAVVAATTNYNGNTSATKAFTIAKAKVNIPTVTANLTFNNQNQSPTISFDTSKCQTTSGSTTSAFHAGDYTITIEIIDKTNYEFTDGTQSKTFSWTIKRFNLENATIIVC